MTFVQKFIKYAAIALAAILTISIFTGLINGFSALANIFDNDVYNGEYIESIIGEEVRSLEIELEFADLNIKTGDELKVETSNNYFKIINSNEHLIVRDKNSMFRAKNYVNIYLPKDFNLDNLKINADAGKTNIEGVNTDNLFLDAGLGDVNVKNVSVLNRAEIKTGIGKFNVENSSLHNLDFESGIGESKLHGNFTGEIDIETGIGKNTITILGNKDDYEISVDKGIGLLMIDGKKVKDGYETPKSLYELDIDHGVGSLKVYFK